MQQKYETEFMDNVLSRGMEQGNFILVKVSRRLLFFYNWYCFWFLQVLKNKDRKNLLAEK